MPDHTPAPSNNLGKYLLLRPIAEGGMAEIFLAKQRGPASFEKHVVIKRVLRPLARDEQFTEMFLDEARLAARLVHPNIVAVHDFGEEDGAYFLCMEYLEGYDLNTLARLSQRQGRRVPATVVALMASAICDGLHYAHTLVDERGRPLGIVHRDISPSNIFVTYQGAVKILDFGIAKATDRLSRTEAGQLKGKVLYMSPEQAEGRPLDARSDLFSLGLVLYLLLAGSHPFMRSNPIASLRAIVAEDAPDPCRLHEDIPEELGAIILRALRRKPDERYPSAQAMREELDTFLATRTSVPAAAQLQGFMRELRASAAAGEAQPTATTSELPAQAIPPTRVSGPAPDQDEVTRGVPAETIRTSRGARPRRWPAALMVSLLSAVGLTVSSFVWKAPVTPGETSTTPDVAPRTPKPRSPAPAPPEPSPGPSPTPGETLDAAARYPPSRGVQAKRFGRLDVNCVPWCDIYIDGRDEGLTSPLIRHRLATGRHRLRFRNPVSQVESTKELHVRAGRVTAVTVSFGEQVVISVRDQEAP